MEEWLLPRVRVGNRLQSLLSSSSSKVRSDAREWIKSRVLRKGVLFLSHGFDDVSIARHNQKYPLES